MLFQKKIFLFLFLIFQTIESFSQTIDNQYFSSPVHFPVRISGNFGELRSNHFHSGIDIKVPAVGTPLYAAAEGYVARISISPWGYGNALYIAHPNGYTTVYGHLYKFSPKIETFLRQKQYEDSTFEINLYPEQKLLRFKKGELIAYAGNTGRSYGAHLHFEVRNTITERVLNPFLFGFDIVDRAKPKFLSVAIYPIGKNASIEGMHKIRYLKTINKKKYYTVQGIIKVSGKIGFGFQAFDRMTGVPNKAGIYRVRLRIDGKLFYAHKIDSLFFSESRAINSLIDYKHYKIKSKRIQKCFVEPGNPLLIYTKKNNGFIFSDTKKHKIEIQVFDFYGNVSKLIFYVKSSADTKILHEKVCKNTISYKKDFWYVTNNFRLTIPRKSIFKNVCFKFSQENSLSKLYLAPIFHVLNPYIPVYKPVILSIKHNKVPPELLQKTSIVLITKKKRAIWLDSREINGFFTAKVKSFGKFTLMADTVPPTISPRIFPRNNNSFVGNFLSFKISDNLSGIESYNGYIDGKWVLFRYNGKNHTIFYHFDQKVKQGKLHRIKIVLKDKKMNTTVFKSTFFK